ncbi:MAG: hypothetical protein MJZ82_04615 [Paludibacteraceae bacterium]|nr:hypothetical protein [Paludibacteraceae bacterium]
MLNFIFAIIVSATIDSTALMIGDQTALHLQVTGERIEELALPIYDKSLIPGIEIVESSPIDTISLGNGQVQLAQDLTLTSFVDSLFYIDPIAFPNHGDTMYSEALTLNIIQPFEIDTTLAITDIKPIERAPRWIWGTLRWILLALFILGLCVGGFFLYRRIQRHRRNEAGEQPKEPERPAEEVALEQLDRIRQEKIWQTGQTKQYHTELTDVVREYIGRRFDVHSTEQTSDETLRAMREHMKDRRELFEKLKNILTLADLVKFAKWTTTPDENEQALRSAYEFVNATTPTEATIAEEDNIQKGERV